MYLLHRATWRHKKVSRLEGFLPYPTEDELAGLKAEAEEALRRLSTTVYKGISPPAGPYSFFHHSSHAIERLNDCHRSVKRLFRGCRRLIELAYQTEELRLYAWPQEIPRPPKHRAILIKEADTSAFLKQDLESLYMFGAILLDQWALQAISIGGVKLRRKHPFAELFEFLQSERASPLDPLWSRVHSQLIWIHYQLRFYRNKFVVHGNRPWQRGTTRRVFDVEFTLHTPSPPGWLDDAEINREIMSLLPLAPEHIRKAPEDSLEKTRPGALLERLFGDIGIIPEKGDREHVARLFGLKGGATPSFQVVARNIYLFIRDATEILDEIATSRLTSIDLGSPG